jgi:aminopeptidase
VSYRYNFQDLFSEDLVAVSIMFDPRIAEHAKIVVNHSVKVKRDDFVLILSCAEARDLMVQIAAEIGSSGASYIVLDNSDSVERSYILAANDETLSKMPPQLYNLIRDSDAFINLSQFTKSNNKEMSDIPPHKLQVLGSVVGQLSALIETKRWNITLHPTPSAAQDANMSFEAYCDFVYSAVLRDWSKMEAQMKVLYDKMSPTDQVRIVGKETDISMSIKGRKPIIDKGENNLPGGEVFTSPIDSTVNGSVYFDLPIIYFGQEIDGCRLVFKDGVIVEHSAEVGSELLEQMLAIDEGAKRVGELGIGMNRGISTFTKNILFDEKMGDSIHMAVGRSFEEAGGTNKSMIHIDMLKAMKEGGTVYFDGEPVYEKGRFVWEIA